jgi:hypothetical protein
MADKYLHMDAGVAHLLCQPVDLVGASTIMPMVKRMPPVPGSGSAFPSRASWVMGNSARRRG